MYKNIQIIFIPQEKNCKQACSSMSIEIKSQKEMHDKM